MSGSTDHLTLRAAVSRTICDTLTEVTSASLVNDVIVAVERDVRSPATSGISYCVSGGENDSRRC